MNEANLISRIGGMPLQLGDLVLARLLDIDEARHGRGLPTTSPFIDAVMAAKIPPNLPSLMLLSQMPASLGTMALSKLDGPSTVSLEAVLGGSSMVIKSESAEIHGKRNSAEQQGSNHLGETPLKKARTVRTVSDSSTTNSDGGLLLLSHPSDQEFLSPLHAYIRQQIEVFTATPTELSEPAPGRKSPIQLHQVGLRCVHCRNKGKRAKRSVCYPSSIARVYHSVSDMKGEHFSLCPYLPNHVKARIQTLKTQEAGKKPTISLTAQHYARTANALGFKDSKSGAIFLEKDLHLVADFSTQSDIDQTSVLQRPPRSKLLLMRKRSQSLPHAVSQESLSSLAPPAERYNQDGRLLALDQDRFHLNDIHCWVRKHIEAFAATEQDVLAPSPGRKQRIYVGQVGLRCVHCAGNSLRVKRAVCYPPTVESVYHSVSNMKFDHFKQCPCLPTADRVEFKALVASTRKKAVAGMGSSNSTARYYKTTAIEIGLVDSDKGMRFRASKQAKVAYEGDSEASVTSIDGLSALAIAATDPALKMATNRRKISV